MGNAAVQEVNALTTTSEPERERGLAPSRNRPINDSEPPARMARPHAKRSIRVGLAVAIVGGPVSFTVGGLLSPTVNQSGPVAISAAATANHFTNGLHVFAFVLATYLLPIGTLGLAWLAYPRTPWLATIGGLLGVIGWAPLSALTALDDVTNVMARMPGAYAALRDKFSTDPVMLSYLLVYVVGHLAAYVLLGIALGRGSVIPRWAAWFMVISSPLTVVAFALPGGVAITDLAGLVALAALSLLIVGCIPPARRVLRA